MKTSPSSDEEDPRRSSRLTISAADSGSGASFAAKSVFEHPPDFRRYQDQPSKFIDALQQFVEENKLKVVEEKSVNMATTADAPKPDANDYFYQWVIVDKMNRANALAKAQNLPDGDPSKADLVKVLSSKEKCRSRKQQVQRLADRKNHKFRPLPPEQPRKKTLEDLLVEVVGPGARLRGKQEEVLRSLVGGADVLAVLATGEGKTAIAEVAALALGVHLLSVAPLVALGQQQADDAPGVHVHTYRGLDSGGEPYHYHYPTTAAASPTTTTMYITPENGQLPQPNPPLYLCVPRSPNSQIRHYF